MKRLLCGLLLLLVSSTAWAADESASGKTGDGSSVAYLLTTTSGQTPRYAVILMPGGKGIMSPQNGNFLIRSRAIFAEGPFVSASTDATSKPDRIMAIASDLLEIAHSLRTRASEYGDSPTLAAQADKLRALADDLFRQAEAAPVDERE